MDTALDVLPDLFGHVPAMTQCDNCSKLITLREAVITTHTISNYITDQEHHCSEACALKSWEAWRGVAP